MTIAEEEAKCVEQEIHKACLLAAEMLGDDLKLLSWLGQWPKGKIGLAQ